MSTINDARLNLVADLNEAFPDLPFTDVWQETPPSLPYAMVVPSRSGFYIERNGSPVGCFAMNVQIYIVVADSTAEQEHKELDDIVSAVLQHLSRTEWHRLTGVSAPQEISTANESVFAGVIISIQSTQKAW